MTITPKAAPLADIFCIYSQRGVLARRCRYGQTHGAVYREVSDFYDYGILKTCQDDE